MNQTISITGLFSKYIKKAVTVSNLSKSDKDTIYFYNHLYKSQVVGITKLDFKITDVDSTSIKEIQDQPDNDLFYNVTGCFRWRGESEQTPQNALRSPNKKFRNGVIHDGKSFLPITVWEQHISILQDDVCYVFENLKTRTYYQLKLTTTTSTNITKSNAILSSSINWTTCEMTDFKKEESTAFQSQFPTWCCPDVKLVSMEIFPACSNEDCKKKMEIDENEEKQKCQHCLFKQKKKDLELQAIFNIVVAQKKNGPKETLTVFPEVLNSYFGKSDIIAEYVKKQGALEDLILDIEDADFTFSASTKIVKSITEHSTKEDLS